MFLLACAASDPAESSDSDTKTLDSDSATTPTDSTETGDSATTETGDSATTETGDSDSGGTAAWAPFSWTDCVLARDVGVLTPEDDVQVASPTVHGEEIWFTIKGVGVQRIAHAVLGDDGLSMSEDQVFLTGDALGTGEVAAPMVTDDGADFFFDAVGETEGATIWRCAMDESRALSGCAPVLGPDQAEEYGADGLQMPHVLAGEPWHMWMTGVKDDVRRILHSTSTDGWTWTDPTLAVDVGTLGDVDDNALYDAFVMNAPGGWRMLYAGLADGDPNTGKRLIEAFSADLETWSGHTVTLEPGCQGPYDSHRVDGPWIDLRETGEFRLYYDGFDALTTEDGTRRLLTAHPG